MINAARAAVVQLAHLNVAQRAFRFVIAAVGHFDLASLRVHGDHAVDLGAGGHVVDPGAGAA